jgi:hypothetical protein
VTGYKVPIAVEEKDYYGLLEPVTRPNGKKYRPRKLRAEVLNTGPPEEEGVLVLGTHNIEIAQIIAQNALDCYEWNLRPVNGWTGWWRSTVRDHETYYEQDTVRGAAGVWFEYTDEPIQVDD